MYVNYIYTQFGIIPEKLTAFYIYFLWLLVLHFDISFVKANIKKVVFILPIYFYPILLLHFYYPSFDAWLKGENKLEEIVQFILFGASTIVSWKLFLSSQKAGRWWKQRTSLLYLFMTVAFFIITFEEISWGQKLFEIDIPERIAEVNTQQEFNIHNNKQIFPYIYYAYLVVSGFAAFAWIIPALFPNVRHKLKKIDLSQFIPPWYLMFYFLLNFVYVLVRKNISHPVLHYYVNEKILSGVNSIWEWEEHSELLIAIGMVFFVYGILKNHRKEQNSK